MRWGCLLKIFKVKDYSCCCLRQEITVEANWKAWVERLVNKMLWGKGLCKAPKDQWESRRSHMQAQGCAHAQERPSALTYGPPPGSVQAGREGSGQMANSNKILASWILQHIKRILHHGQVGFIKGMQEWFWHVKDVYTILESIL